MISFFSSTIHVVMSSLNCTCIDCMLYMVLAAYSYTLLTGESLRQEPTLVSHFDSQMVSEPNPLRPLRDLHFGLGETVFDGCRHLEYMNIWGFNEPK